MAPISEQGAAVIAKSSQQGLRPVATLASLGRKGIKLVVAVIFSFALLKWVQKRVVPKDPKQHGYKDLREAPSLNQFHFLWTRKGIAEVLIAEFRRFTESGSKVGCIWFGWMKFVVATHPETAKEVLTKGTIFKKANVLTLLDGPMRTFYTDENDNRVPDLPMSNDAVWYRQRKHFNPAFSSKSLEKLIPKFWNEATIFVQLCKSESIPVVESLSHFAMDCLGAAVLGRSFDAQAGKFKDIYEAYLEVVGCLGNPVTNLFPSLFKLPLERNRKVFQAAEKIKRLLIESWEQKKADRDNGVLSSDGSTTLLDLIVEATESAKSFPTDSIIPNLWTFFLAGHDTTAVSLAWLLNILAQFPEVQEKAREEVKSVLGDLSQPPTLKQLDELVYLNAVLQENLRLNPSLYNLATRECVQDTVLDGYFVPKGTQVSVAIQAVNTHGEIWEDAHSFKPERFLNKEPRKEDAYNCLSFSVGARACIGNKFSLIEQKCLLAQLLVNYVIQPSQGEPKRDRHMPLSNSTISFLFKQPEPYTLRFTAPKTD